MLVRSVGLIEALGLNPRSRKAAADLAQQSGLSVETIKWMNRGQFIPDRRSLQALAAAAGISDAELCLRLGFIDDEVLERLRVGDTELAASAPQKLRKPKRAVFKNKFGQLHRADCLDLLRTMPSESVDLVFADPPFNLAKDYPSKMDDARKDEDYLQWAIRWLDECVRVLRFGGSIFIYNLPKWNLRYAEYLSRRLNFRHAISIRMAFSLPIAGRLYPAHYSMLYLVKGPRPRTFKPDRMAMATCPKCYGDLVDYGGHKSKMNPAGVNLTDVWTDIAPVRHSKYKKRKGSNELSLRLMDRVIEMASEPGDLVFDPFGGSGTSYVAAQLKQRRWLGCEIGPTEGIVERLGDPEQEGERLASLRSEYNALHPPMVKSERLKRGLWTTDSFCLSTRVEEHDVRSLQTRTNEEEV